VLSKFSGPRGLEWKLGFSLTDAIAKSDGNFGTTTARQFGHKAHNTWFLGNVRFSPKDVFQRERMTRPREIFFVNPIMSQAFSVTSE
jgi:hypothetical protein